MEGGRDCIIETRDLIGGFSAGGCLVFLRAWLLWRVGFVVHSIAFWNMDVIGSFHERFQSHGSIERTNQERRLSFLILRVNPTSLPHLQVYLIGIPYGAVTQRRRVVK